MKYKQEVKTMITFEGQPCRKCQTPVVKREHTKAPKHKAGGYYFLQWFQCPGCKTNYMVESSKRFFDTDPFPTPSAEMPLFKLLNEQNRPVW